MEAVVREIKVNEIMSNIKKLFIPDIQRNYKWDKSKIESLLSYIMADEVSRSESFGIITLGEKTEDGVTLIDGQQRLTTISLIYCTITGTHPFELRFKNFNNKTLGEIMNPASGYKVSISNYTKAVNIIKEYTKNIDTDVLLNNLLKINFIVSITNTETLVEFNNINANKVPLSVFDLVKANQLLSNPNNRIKIQSIYDEISTIVYSGKTVLSDNTNKKFNLLNPIYRSDNSIYYNKANVEALRDIVLNLTTKDAGIILSTYLKIISTVDKVRPLTAIMDCISHRENKLEQSDIFEELRILNSNLSFLNFHHYLYVSELHKSEVPDSFTNYNNVEYLKEYSRVLCPTLEPSKLEENFRYMNKDKLKSLLKQPMFFEMLEMYGKDLSEVQSTEKKEITTKSDSGMKLISFGGDN